MQMHTLVSLMPGHLPDSKNKVTEVTLLGDGTLLSSYDGSGCFHLVNPIANTKVRSPGSQNDLPNI